MIDDAIVARTNRVLLVIVSAVGAMVTMTSAAAMTAPLSVVTRPWMT